MSQVITCRSNCGACCVAPSISSVIPGMPHGKPANTVCVQLDEDYSCKIFNSPERPLVCASLSPSILMCGKCREDALTYLEELERLTAPEMFDGQKN